MPDFVDAVVVVDDASEDDTMDVVRQYQNKTDKIEVIQHETNKGVGAAISTGYIRARDKAYDATAVMVDLPRAADRDRREGVLPA